MGQMQRVLHVKDSPSDVVCAGEEYVTTVVVHTVKKEAKLATTAANAHQQLADRSEYCLSPELQCLCTVSLWLGSMSAW